MRSLDLSQLADGLFGKRVVVNLEIVGRPLFPGATTVLISSSSEMHLA